MQHSTAVSYPAVQPMTFRNVKIVIGISNPKCHGRGIKRLCGVVLYRTAVLYHTAVQHSTAVSYPAVRPMTFRNVRIVIGISNPKCHGRDLRGPMSQWVPEPLGLWIPGPIWDHGRAGMSGWAGGWEGGGERNRRASGEDDYGRDDSFGCA